jgi:hypothetical protein
MLNKREKVMRKLLGVLLTVGAVGVSTAQMVTYLDAQGRPFMYSNKIGNQTIYMDANGKPVAYQTSLAPSGPRVDPINMPSLLFPMVSPSFPGGGTIAPLPSLPTIPELPTLKGF